MFKFYNSLHLLDLKISFRITFLVVFWFGLFFRFFNSYLFHLQNILMIYVLFFLLFFAFFTNKKNVKYFLNGICNENFLIKVNKIKKMLDLDSKLSWFLGFFIYACVDPLFYRFESDEYVLKGFVIVLSVYKILIFLSLSFERFLSSALFKEYQIFYFHHSGVNLGGGFPAIEGISANIPKGLIPGLSLLAGAFVVTTEQGRDARDKAHQELDAAREKASQLLEESRKKFEMLEESRKKAELLNSQVKDFRRDSESLTLGQQELKKSTEKEVEQLLVEHGENAENLVKKICEEKSRLEKTSDIKLGLQELGYTIGDPKLTGSALHTARLLREEAIELASSQQVKPPLVLEFFFLEFFQIFLSR